MQSKTKQETIKKFVLYAVIIAITLVMIIPFIWMLSASLKLSRDVFVFPIEWIPSVPRWQNL